MKDGASVVEKVAGGTASSNFGGSMLNSNGFKNLNQPIEEEKVTDHMLVQGEG